MTLVRERRHQQALKLSLPPPISPAELRHRTPLSALLLSSTSTTDSPVIDNLSDLEKLAVLGHGSGGTVYKVRHRKSASIYALKVIRFSENAITTRLQAVREAEILKRVDSQYVLRCHAVFDDGFTNADGSGDLCFVMEYMEAGSLHDILRVRRRLPEKVISGVAKRVLEGLHYLHGIQIVHGDIKPSNLLINSNGYVKIVDFGVSHVAAGKPNACNSYYMGTCAYMSPERFDPERRGGDYSDGLAGDVWSVGVTVLECHVGHFPLIGPGKKLDWVTLMCAICFGEKMEMPETASSEFRSFVWKCLEKDWRKRGTVAELLGHPFVNNAVAILQKGWLIDFLSFFLPHRLDFLLFFS